MTNVRRNYVSAFLFPVCAALALLSTPRLADGQDAAARKPIRHVIFISVDSLRADYLACYGNEYIKSPNIDQLAKQGVLFEQHISASSETLPAHTSMFTGTYPHSHGVPRNGYYIGDKNIMLTEVLKDAGFQTAGFVSGPALSVEVNFKQGFDHFDIPERREPKSKYGPGLQRAAEQVTEKVNTWLEERAKGPDAMRRLFLFVHYFDPHSPYYPPRPFKRMYRDDNISVGGGMKGISKTRGRLRHGYVVTGEGRFPRGGGRSRFELPTSHTERVFAEEGLAGAKALAHEYAAEVTYCDSEIGRFVEALKKHNLFEDALIVVTADHGETLGEHRNAFSHGDYVYDTEIHTPLIVRLPGEISAGKRVGALVSQIDLMPSLLEWLGLKAPGAVEGQSFAEVLQGEVVGRDAVFAEATRPYDVDQFQADPVWPNKDKTLCIRTAQHKYMARRGDGLERFYDLKADPTEQNNLLERDQKYDAQMMAKLKQRLTAWRDSAKPLESRRIVRKKPKAEATPSKDTAGSTKKPGRGIRP